MIPLGRKNAWILSISVGYMIPLGRMTTQKTTHTLDNYVLTLQILGINKEVVHSAHSG